MIRVCAADVIHSHKHHKPSRMSFGEPLAMFGKSGTGPAVEADRNGDVRLIHDADHLVDLPVGEPAGMCMNVNTRELRPLQDVLRRFQFRRRAELVEINTAETSRWLGLFRDETDGKRQNHQQQTNRNGTCSGVSLYGWRRGPMQTVMTQAGGTPRDLPPSMAMAVPVTVTAESLTR